MLLAITSILLLGPSPKAVRKELAADYALFAKAFEARDIQAMGRLMADDYVLIQGGRIQRKRQVLADFQSMMSMSTGSSWNRKITDLKLSGKTAEAKVDGLFKGSMKGPNGKTQSLEFAATSQDTWVATPVGYRLKKSVLLKNVMKIDGKILAGRH